MTTRTKQHIPTETGLAFAWEANGGDFYTGMIGGGAAPQWYLNALVAKDGSVEVMVYHDATWSETGPTVRFSRRSVHHYGNVQQMLGDMFPELVAD